MRQSPRWIGSVTDADGVDLHIYQDDDTILIGANKGDRFRMTRTQRLQLAELLEEAGYQADVWEPTP